MTEIKLRNYNIINSFSMKCNSFEKSKLLVKKTNPGTEFEVKNMRKRMLRSIFNSYEAKNNCLLFF